MWHFIPSFTGGNMEKKLVERRMHEKKAQKIVERLSEETVSRAVLSSLARFIEQYHYEEIVEERFLAKVCGYPICGNELTNIPTQKYHISSAANKVYDITDRKRFCSGECFKSSKLFASQISTVPVWSRDKVENIMVVTEAAVSSAASKHGTELISKSTLYSNEIERELSEIEKDWRTKMSLVEKNLSKKPTKQKHVLVKDDVKERVQKDGVSEEASEPPSAAEHEQKLNKFIPVDESEYLLRRIFPTIDLNEKFQDKARLIEYLTRRLDDLMTAEARSYIKNNGNEFEKVHSERERLEFQQKYLNYKSRIEIDNNLDSDDDLDMNSQRAEAKVEERKPLPYFEKLKEEAALQQLKVKEFFYPSTQESAPERSDTNENEYVLPEVDSISQSQIRQRIFFEKLFKHIENLIKYSDFNLKVINIELKNHVKNLISILNLTNENLIFKSNEWPIVSIVFLEMLSRKFKSLNNILCEDRFIKTILNALNLDQNSLKTISTFLIEN